MNPTTHPTATRIREAREKRGLTQMELAKQANCDQASISRYENGRGIPHRTVAKRLGKVLKVQPQQRLSQDAIRAAWILALDVEDDDGTPTDKAA